MFGFACVVSESMDDDFVCGFECDGDWGSVFVFDELFVTNGVAGCWQRECRYEIELDVCVLSVFENVFVLLEKIGGRACYVAIVEYVDGWNVVVVVVVVVVGDVVVVVGGVVVVGSGGGVVVVITGVVVGR